MKKILLILIVMTFGVVNISNAQDSKAEKKLQKEQKKADKKEANQEKFAELLANWQAPKATGDSDIDAFYLSCKVFLDQTREQKINYDRLKFQVDSLENGQYSMSVIDIQTNTNVGKEEVKKQLSDINLNYLDIALTGATTLATGANLLNELTKDPMKAFKVAAQVKSLKSAIDAVRLGVNELPKMAQAAKERKESVEMASKYIE